MEAPFAIDLAVIGGGPAGLKAAEVAAQAGFKVVVFDGKPSIGRKFLVAGRGGLNLTHSEDFEDFVRRYSGSMPNPSIWRSLLEDFGPSDSVEWARSLGIETFTARNGRIYPTEMKAAPLLRRWQMRLRELGVEFSMKHHLVDLTPGFPYNLAFANGNRVSAKAVILALGGASWPLTGSDAAWLGWLGKLSIQVNPLQPANCGWECDWHGQVLDFTEGKPLKNLRVTAGQETVDGELLITRYGLEGGAIYQLGKSLRAMREPVMHIDFKPTFTRSGLLAKLGTRESQGQPLIDIARYAWKLGDAAYALLKSRAFANAEELTALTKDFPVRLRQARPIAEAISSAGGIDWRELDQMLMLKDHPGLFAAGEMLDWEAPTGGYLMQGCLATGRRAGMGAAAWLSQQVV